MTACAGPPAADSSAEPLVPVFDDRRLLAAMRAGDELAAGAVYRRVRPTVDRTLTRLVGARDPDYQDLVQQTMIELIISVERYRGDCPLDAWISTVTAHAVYKQLRRRQRERRIFERGLCMEAVATEPHPAQRMTMRGLLGRIADHLDAMQSGRAWAFVLHDVHGYDLRETAAIMDISVAAAQARLSRGRRELHERVAHDPELAGTLDRAAS
jgi:RNA polymerase sigma-70 factor (ECF subfamily)